LAGSKYEASIPQVWREEILQHERLASNEHRSDYRIYKEYGSLALLIF